MERLTLEQAALKYDTDNFNHPTAGSNVLIPESTAQQWNINAFKSGAEWQKEQISKAFNELMPILKEAFSICLSEGQDDVVERAEAFIDQLQLTN